MRHSPLVFYYIFVLVRLAAKEYNGRRHRRRRRRHIQKSEMSEHLDCNVAFYVYWFLKCMCFFQSAV